MAKFTVPIARPMEGKPEPSPKHVRIRYLDQNVRALREPPNLHPCWTVPPGRCAEDWLMRNWLIAAVAGRCQRIPQIDRSRV